MGDPKHTEGKQQSPNRRIYKKKGNKTHRPPSTIAQPIKKLIKGLVRFYIELLPKVLLVKFQTNLYKSIFSMKIMYPKKLKIKWKMLSCQTLKSLSDKM